MQSCPGSVIDRKRETLKMDQDHRAGTIPQRPLGRTGIQVSALGLGGHHLGDL